jgi:hypothetical protein
VKTGNTSTCTTVFESVQNRDSAIIACSKKLCKCISANKSNHPIQYPLLLFTDVPICDRMLNLVLFFAGVKSVSEQLNDVH